MKLNDREKCLLFAGIVGMWDALKPDIESTDAKSALHRYAEVFNFVEKMSDDKFEAGIPEGLRLIEICKKLESGVSVEELMLSLVEILREAKNSEKSNAH